MKVKEYFKKGKVHDQLVAKIVDGKITFLSNDERKGKSIDQIKKHPLFSKDFTLNSSYVPNVIIMLLESPHTDEFDGNGSTGPAFGKTGENIRKYIMQQLNKTNISSDKPYHFYLVNAVQFQCSEGKSMAGNKENKLNRTQNFEEDFNEADFVLRLQKILKMYEGEKNIINCCTLLNERDKKNPLKKMLQNVIDQNFNDCNRFIGYHPSSPLFWKNDFSVH